MYKSHKLHMHMKNEKNKTKLKINGQRRRWLQSDEKDSLQTKRARHVFSFHFISICRKMEKKKKAENNRKNHSETKPFS